MAGNLATDFEAKLDDITQRGVSAIRSTEKTANAAISSAANASRDALDSAEQVRDSVNGAILHSIKVRPYTTLAIARQGDDQAHLFRARRRPSRHDHQENKTINQSRQNAPATPILRAGGTVSVAAWRTPPSCAPARRSRRLA